MAFFATSLLLLSGRAVGQLTVFIGMIKDPFLFIANKTKSQKSCLSPGRHAFQFSFRIPPYSLPSSFESNYGYVRYWIKARIHRRWRFDEVAKEMLNILSVVDVNCPRMLVRHTHMLYCIAPKWVHRFGTWILSNFYPPFVFLKCFITSTLILTTSRLRVYWCIREISFFFWLRNCWKSTSENLGYGLIHRPLSRQVWSTLKNLNLLSPRSAQRGRNHLRRLNDRPINAIIRGERQQNLQEKRCGANQSNSLNIPVNIFAAETTSHGTLHSTIHGSNSQKSKVTLAHLNVWSLKTREHLIQVSNLMDEKKYAIWAISESWLNSSVKDAQATGCLRCR